MEPPQSIHSEQAVLGSMLLDPECIPLVTDTLWPGDFYRQANGIIYQAIKDIHERGGIPDHLLVENELGDNLEKVGGLAYIMDLVGAVPSTTGVENHVKVVKDKALLRRLMASGKEVMELAEQQKKPVLDLLDQAQRSVLQVAEGASAGKFDGMPNLLDAFFKRMEEGKARENVKTGLSALDDIIGGLYPSDLIILAARPSMGKTALAMNIALRVAQRDKRVAVVSLEMSKEQLTERLISMKSGVDAWKVRTENTTREDNEAIASAMESLSKTPLFVEDEPVTTIAEIRANCRRLQAREGLDLLIVDYLQLLTPTRRNDSRVQEVSEMTRNLKQLAKDLNVPVLVLSQLSRGVENRSDNRPQLFDLRESGSIEQDADVAMFIYREVYYNSTAEPNAAEVIVRKHRNGPIGTAKLRFDPNRQRFLG